MLVLPCPCCGPRAQTEFVCDGEAHIARPGSPARVEPEAWADYLFFRRNPRGLHHERWCHVHGCGQWFNLARDTLTHAIGPVYAMTDPKPEGG